MSLKFRDDDIDHSGRFRGVQNKDHGHDTDRYNMALINSDPVLRRLLMAYSKLSEAARWDLADLADELRKRDGSADAT